MRIHKYDNKNVMYKIKQKHTKHKTIHTMKNIEPKEYERM
jgi:hypothetical protein